MVILILKDIPFICWSRNSPLYFSKRKTLGWYY